MAGGPPRILHLTAAFDADPGSMRLVRLINALGKHAEHAIVSDDRDRRGAARQLAKEPRVAWPKFPPLRGSRLPGRLTKLSAAMAGYDLICTHGYGAIDAAMAHTLFADVHKLPPLVHHEHEQLGTGKGDRRRAWYRRFALGRSAALVVPTKALETVALTAWDQPRERVRLIPDGIDTRAVSAPPRRDLLPGLIKRRDEHWIGTFADAQTDDLEALVRALPQAPPEWQLVIVGEAAGREALEAEATRLGIEYRVHFPGPVEAQASALGLFDVLALPAPPAPELVMAAMAAGLPLVGARNDPLAAMLASDNNPLLAEPGDGEALALSLLRLARHPDERKRIGLANRTKAREEFDEKRMIERLRALYWGLIGRQARER